MLGIGLGCEIIVNNKDVNITVVIRETGELHSIYMPYQMFVKKLLGRRHWWQKDFVVDRISADSTTKGLWDEK